MQFATVAEVTANGVRLQFDGEETASKKEYKLVRSYHPAVGDRVSLMEDGNTWLVAGSVGSPKGAISGLASNATLAATIAKVNEIISAL